MRKVNPKKGIIIQARMGSKRLPGKMGRIFFQNKSLLEVVLERVYSVSDDCPFIVATSHKPEDDYIEKTAIQSGFKVYRGSESDLIKRFLEAADLYKIESIIRICADNPFIQPKRIKYLLNLQNDKTEGYTAYRINGDNPAIRSHLGFFPEMIETVALRSVSKLVQDHIFREHVTNYFYNKLNKCIPVNWIDLVYPIEISNKVRLTIDTLNDFELLSRIYTELHLQGLNGSEEEIIGWLKKNPDAVSNMEKNILENEK